MAGRHRDNPSDTNRRRFLVGLASIAGLGTIGSLLRNVLGGDESGASSTSTSSATSGSATSTHGSAPSTDATSTTSTTEATTTTAESTTTAAETTTTSEAVTTTSETTATEASTTSTSQPATTVTSQPETGAGLVLLEKAAWGAEPEGEGFEAHTVTRITVHHTALVLGSNDRAPAHIRQHQRYHQSLGWPDLAYHVMIDRNGNLYEGRPMEFRGDTGTSYDPSGHFLPCLEGEYGSESPSAAQMEALAQVCAWAADRWGLASSTIGGHRDHASTACPGVNVYDDISTGALAARVDEILSSGVPALGYLRGEDAAAVVAAIEAGG